MDFELAGKRAFISGSTSGIGQRTAEMLAAEGVTVVINGRNEERGNAVVEGIRSGGGAAVLALGDLSTDDGAQGVFDLVDGELDGVDIVFNNAGGAAHVRNPSLGADRNNPPFLKTTTEDWANIYQYNVLSALRVTKHFAPGMVERGFGRFIQCASTAAWNPPGSIPDYSGAKAALLNFSVALAKALGGTGVTANSISPGLILTPAQLGEHSFLRGYARSQEWDDSLPLEEIEKMWAKANNVPAGHAGRVENIAAAVLLLASPVGGFINGANIRVDGGFSPTIN